MPSLRARPCLLFLWSFGGAALLLGFMRDLVLREEPLPFLDANDTWVAGEFRPNGAYVDTRRGTLPRHIETLGSWLDTDAWTGRAETPWLRAHPGKARVGVAGYPQHAGCRLILELRDAAGGVQRVDCLIENPREEWQPWSVSVPAGIVALRVVAEDQASDSQGWLAFSRPFVEKPALLVAGYMFLQVATTLALALTLVWGPGLWWSQRFDAPELLYTVLLMSGPLLLTGGGVVIWLLASLVEPTLLGLVIIGCLWLAVGSWILKSPEIQLSAPLASVLAVSALVVLAVTAKATYSVGPEGELFRSTVGRTLAVGDRSDSGIPYTVVQLATHGISPTSPEGEREFSPWTFYSRGPLAGLATVPVLLATGGSPPAKWPSDPWEPYDRLGYASYRIVLMVLASSVIVALFGALAIVVGESWALIGAGLLALSPFGVHEVMFTWPKWPATAGVLVSFMLAHTNRGYWAGAALAVGFFYHPMALLAAPWIAFWVLARNGSNLRTGLRVLLRLTAATGVLALPWMLLAAYTPHLAESTHGGHSTFLRYWLLADYEPATWETWWRSRWRNFANTFIPFRLYWVDGNHPTLNSFYGPSPPLVRFAFSWWNSLPLGLGLGLWAVCVVAFVRGLRQWPLVVGLLIIGPAITITAYFGAISAGLMRECGHFLFAATIGLTCVTAARGGGFLQSILGYPATPWLQLPETLLMLWMTTVVNHNPVGSPHDTFDMVYAIISIAALAGAAAILSRMVGTYGPAGDGASSVITGTSDHP